MDAKVKCTKIQFPGQPYDIFLRRKEHRVFTKRGSKSTALSVSKELKYVYYHPPRSCVPGKNNGRQIWAGAFTKANLGLKHKELLWREVSVNL